MIRDRYSTRRLRSVLLMPVFNLVLLAVSACQPESGPDPAPGTVKPEATAERPASGGTKFALINGNVRQTLVVRDAADDSIHVSIAVASPCTRHEQGVAIPVPDEGDMDIEVDNEGEGYPVDVYFLEPRPSCTISVRFAAGDEPYAWVRDVGCPGSCPLSDEVMHKE